MMNNSSLASSNVTRDVHNFCHTMAKKVSWALEQELRLSPKPGLVDSINNGAHDDLNLDMMLASIGVIEPYFYRMALASWQQQADVYLRETIGQLGRDAERAMLVITGGVNAHRGAIWAQGLLLCAAAQNYQDLQVNTLCSRAAKLAQIHDRHKPLTFTQGNRVCNQYQTTGALEQAQQGFPAIVELGLPMLHFCRGKNDSESEARLNALIAIMTTISDTCVLSRSGLKGLSSMHYGAQRILDFGGTGTLSGRLALLELDRQMLHLNASPGGAADLLGATLFLDAITGDFMEGE